jgi:hypothetical protein
VSTRIICCREIPVNTCPSALPDWSGMVWDAPVVTLIWGPNPPWSAEPAPGNVADASGSGASFSGSASNAETLSYIAPDSYPSAGYSHVVLTGRMKYWGGGGVSFLDILGVSGYATPFLAYWTDPVVPPYEGFWTLPIDAPLAQADIQIYVGGSQVIAKSAMYFCNVDLPAVIPSGSYEMVIPPCCGAEADIEVRLTCRTGGWWMNTWNLWSAPNAVSISALLHN